MAGYISGDTRKVTTHRLVEMKQRGEKISMLTSYDYTTAQIVDEMCIRDRDMPMICYSLLKNCVEEWLRTILRNN